MKNIGKNIKKIEIVRINLKAKLNLKKKLNEQLNVTESKNE